MIHPSGEGKEPRHDEVRYRSSESSLRFCMHRGFFCAASASSANIVIIMGAMVMASIFVAVIISLLGIIRLPLLIMMPFILAVLGMNLR